MRWGEESRGGREEWARGQAGGRAGGSHYSQRAPNFWAPSRGRGVMVGRLARRRDSGGGSGAAAAGAGYSSGMAV